MMRVRRYEFGPFRLDAAGGVLFRGSQRLALRPKLVEILTILIEARGNPVGKQELLNKVWADTAVEEGSLTSHISLLRKALGEEAGGFIETIPKRGYRFSGLVSEEKEAPAADEDEPRLMFLVLPFENFSGDKDQEYFSDGLTEEMITQLGRLNPMRLGVIARTTAMQFKASRKPIQQIGRELGVAYILEGSARRSGNRVRIAAQLIQVKDQTHLWTENYDRDLGDILILQSEVTQAIAEQIEIALLPGERARLNKIRRVDPQAYEDYLRGRYFWNQRTPKALVRATDLFEKAAARDPGSALAYSALADCYAIPGTWSWTEPRSASQKAKNAAARAVQLDDGLAEPHASLANVLSMFERRWLEAEREFERALELNPNYATARHWYSFHLVAMGRLPEAIVQIRRAQQLDPLSLIINTNVGTILAYARRFDEAIAEYNKTLLMDPEFWTAHWMLGLALEQKGKYREAVAEHKSAIKNFQDQSTLLQAALARAAALAGARKDASRLLDQLSKMGKSHNLPLYDIGLVHAALGDKDTAFRLLRKSGEGLECWFARLKYDPRMDSLRGDARYSELLHMLALPD